MASDTQYNQNTTPSAFTIIELLVVIVIIAVLAAITLVSYTSISRQAVVSTMQSDLSNASTALKAFQAETSNFPTTISTDCNTSPDTTTNKCLKVSGGNTYSNYVASNGAIPKSFSLTVSNPSLSYSYIITSDSKPAALSPAPNSPVADWLATTQGDHYGNFYDLVSKQYATVTRASTKTIYDPNTQHIYDVPANYLAITPRSDGKSGVEAVVEEGRTNYLTNSDGENTLGNPAWFMNNWGSSTTAITQDSTSSVHNSKAVKFTTTNWVDNSFSLVAWNNNLTSTIPMTSGVTYTFSVWGKVLTGSAAYRLDFQDTNGTTSQSITLTDKWQRFSVSRTLGSSVTNIVLRIYATGGNQSSLWDAAQAEVGSFATSYIPTTTTTATRNADLVSIPTTDWGVSSGSQFVVAGDNYTSPTSTASGLLYWVEGANNNKTIVYLQNGSYGNLNAGTKANSVNYLPAAITRPLGYFVGAMTYNTGSAVNVYINGGSKVSSGAQASDLMNMPTTASIGAYGGSIVYNGPIQRTLIYSSYLSDSDISSVSNSVKDGPQ